MGIPQGFTLFPCAKVLVREKQKSEEVNRLQDVIQKLLHDAGTKTKQEVSHGVVLRRDVIIFTTCGCIVQYEKYVYKLTCI